MRVALGVIRKPPLARAFELGHLVVADPVVLRVVEHREQHVELPQRLGQPHAARERHRAEARITPLRESGVERDALLRDLPSARPEQPLHHVVVAAHRHHGDLDPQPRRRTPPAPDRSRCVRSSRCGTRRRSPRRACSTRRRAGRSRSGERSRVTAEPLVPDQPHGVDLEEHRESAALARRLRGEHVHLADGRRERLRAGGMLVQQVASTVASPRSRFRVRG